MKQFTIRFLTESTDAAKDIFESFLTGKVLNGIKVTAITDGDLFKRLDATEQQLDIYNEYFGDELGYEEQERFDELEKVIDQTWDRNL